MELHLTFVLFVALAGICVMGQNLPDDITVPNNIKSPDDVQAIVDFKTKCRETAGNEAMDEIENAMNNVPSCITTHINPNKLQHEIDVSIPRGELDVVFKKYCKKRDDIMECAENFFTKLEVCLDEKQQRDLNVTRRALEAGIDFICHDEGDRIALFMGEEGKECVSNHSKSIQKCIEKSVPDLKEGVENPNAMKIEDFMLNEENCKKMNSMHSCVVKYTKKCDDPTPSNILDSLIISMLKVTPCWETSGALQILPTLLTLLAAALSAANILL